MNDEQLHQNSLEIGRKLIEKAPELRGWVESKLPELKESEDNRIIKSIIEFVKQNNSFTCCKGVSKDDCIAWLKSLKPKYWKPSIEQMSFLYSAICAAEESKSYHTKKILETLYHDLEKI